MDLLDQPLGALPKAAADKDKSGCCTETQSLCAVWCTALRFYLSSVHHVFSHWVTDKCALCSLLSFLHATTFIFLPFDFSKSLQCHDNSGSKVPPGGWNHLVYRSSDQTTPHYKQRSQIQSEPLIVCLSSSLAANTFVYRARVSWARYLVCARGA